MNPMVNMASVSSAFVPLAVLLFALLFLYRAQSRGRKLPPGPKGLPILGNLLQIDNRPWLRFTQWKEKYGKLIPIMSYHEASVLT